MIDDLNERGGSPALRRHLDALLHRLSLERKVQLLTGGTFWSTTALPEIGLRTMVLSDGPSGVRGVRWDERDPSLNLPAGDALAASWDVDLARRYGAVAASEARRKGVDVILGPTINLHRSPLGGRSFECFSEDPVLSGRLAASYVDGVQRNGVAATPKHYVANDSETERLTVSVEVSDRALRELYLLAFEPAIRDAGAWLVMTAYNSVGGTRMTEHPLLEDPLNTEWGFDGVVVSDWGAVRSLDAARAMQDLVMPGPDGPWGEALIEAVTSGRIPETAVDRKVARLLLLAARVGALDSVATAATPIAEDAPSFLRHAAREGLVLVKNGDAAQRAALPLDPAPALRIGVFGQNARFVRTQGGGSATVVPDWTVSPLDGLRNVFGAEQVTYRAGVGIADSLLEFPLDHVSVPGSSESGVLVELLAAGEVIHRAVRRSGLLVDFGPDAPFEQADAVVITTVLRRGDLDWMRVGFASIGTTTLSVDGRIVLDETFDGTGEELGATFLTPPLASADLTDCGDTVLLRYEHDLTSRPLDTFFSFGLGLLAEAADPDELLSEAVAAAHDVDVAVVVVGTSERVESEGFDRTTLALDGRQDDLVRAIARTGTPVVAVVNSGGPVLLPWEEQVSAILIAWFGGQAIGQSIADVIAGIADPGGRLPVTWPKTQESVPVLGTAPTNGILDYAEGIHVGYRAWLRAGATPAFPFGHGLSYTDFEVVVEGHVTVGPESATVSTSVRNTGARDGKHVVQVYASRRDSAVDRPERWLVGFATVRLAPGESRHVDLSFPLRALSYWDEELRAWTQESGRFTLTVSRSAEVDDASVDLYLEGAPGAADPA